MRHLPYFTELAELGDTDASWRSVTAGLVVLRLVDAWIEEGSAIVAADSWGVRSVRAAIDDMPEGLPARTILHGVVDALTSSGGIDLHAVAPRLMAYARSLDLDGQWALAADVYETIIAHAHPVEDSDVAVNALLRRGRCLREIGRTSDAMDAYTMAAEVAQRCGDMVGMLTARVGEAKIIVGKGNLPAAESILEETIARSTEHSLLAVRSLAMHERASIAHLRGQYDIAVRFAYDAMQDCASETQRDRILGDLAGSFYMLGDKSAARDAFLVLAATAREQYQRWVATINLMELAAEEGVSIQFERYKQQLASSELPPLLKAQFELHAGRGHQSIGDYDAARPWLERAASTAAAHSFNQLLFAAEDALSRKPAAEPPVQPRPFEIPSEVAQIAVELKGMRQLAGV